MESGGAQREDGDLRRDADANGWTRGAETWVHVKRRISIAIQAKMKPMRELSETDELREKGERDLPTVRMPGEHEADALLGGRGKERRVVRQEQGESAGLALFEGAAEVGSARPGSSIATKSCAFPRHRRPSLRSMMAPLARKR